MAAKQPLSLQQLEECCLVRVLQESSIKEQYVNGIHLVDSWFQGLVEVDHETETVHFIHSSVQRFFLEAPVDPAYNGFYVSMEEADRHIGEVILTYLNFNDFKKTLAQRRRALPPISPEAILQHALGNRFGLRNYLLRGRGTQAADIDGTIATCTQTSRATLQETMDLKHPFLSYASTSWLSHSFNFNSYNCQVWHIWKDILINGHELTTSPVSDGYHQAVDEALARWAISIRHTPLLYVVATSKDLIHLCRREMLHYAVDRNDPELMSLLVKGLTRDPRFGLLSPCLKAARHGYVEILKILIKAGVAVDGDNTKRPLIEAIEAGQIEVVKLLLASGAKPDLIMDVGLSPLERSIDKQDIQLVKLLIKFGANVNRRSQSVMTPLVRACSREYPSVDIIELLFKAGAKFKDDEDSDFEHSDFEKHDFEIMKKAVRDRNGRLLQLLIKQNILAYWMQSHNLILLAARNGSFEIMNILIEAGVMVKEDVFEDVLSKIPADIQGLEQREEGLRSVYKQWRVTRMSTAEN